MRRLYYIQNKGYCGNCLIWWSKNGNGYTCNLDDAWKVSLRKAEQLCRPDEDIAWRCDIVDAKAVRHVTTAAGLRERK